MSREKETGKAFITHKANGFYLTFPNGNSLSTVWGSGTYSDNHDWEHPDGLVATYQTQIKEGSNTVETMPNCSKTVLALLEAKFSEESNCGVFAYLTFEKWLEMVNILNNHS